MLTSEFIELLVAPLRGYLPPLYALFKTPLPRDTLLLEL